MNGLQLLLPPSLQPYTKGWVALILAIAVSLSAVLSAPLWLTIVIAVLTPVAVFFQSNDVTASRDLEPEERLREY